MKTSSASRGKAERAWAVHPNGSELVADALNSAAGAAARANRSTLRVRAPFRSTSAPPARTLAAGIEISITHELQSIEAEWRELEKHGEYTAFQAFDWLATWQRHIGELDGVVPAVVLGRHADGHLLFILPLGRAGSVLALSGEFARWQGISGRMVADALHLARNAQLAARALRT